VAQPTASALGEEGNKLEFKCFLKNSFVREMPKKDSCFFGKKA